MLGTSEDIMENFEKTGIYWIKCNDCDENILVIFATGFYNDLKNTHTTWEIRKIAQHILQKKHSLDNSSLRFIGRITDNRHLDVYRSLGIREAHNKKMFNFGTIVLKPYN